MKIRLQESVMPEATYLATLMTPIQVARKIGWHAKRVRRLIYSGKLPSVKISGRSFVRREDFEDYARRQGVIL